MKLKEWTHKSLDKNIGNKIVKIVRIQNILNIFALLQTNTL